MSTTIGPEDPDVRRLLTLKNTIEQFTAQELADVRVRADHEANKWQYDLWVRLLASYDALVAERDRLREALRIIERSIAGDAQGLQRIARGALGEEEPKRHFQVGFKGGPWDGQFYEVEHIVGPVFAVGDLVGNHYWFDSNSGNKPTYHWDGTEWAVKDGIHPQC